MTEKQYRLNKWGTRLLKNNRPLFDWTNESDKIVDLLNGLNDENEGLKEEIARQKYTKHIMRENIKSYERAIKRLRKSYEEFDEMRLERIRFLEKRLKKNGLSIYVTDCGDIE